MVCSKCGAECADNTVYCGSCGTRLDGKTVCVCGNTFEGNYCPVCGRKNQETKPPVTAKSEAINGLKKYTDIAGIVFAAIAALLAIIFTFFIGVSDRSSLGSSSSATVTDISLFYYFGDAYIALSDLTYMLSSPTLMDFYKLKELCTIFNTVASALIIATTIALFFVALFKSLKSICNNKLPGIAPFIAIALGYICGAVVFISLNGQSKSVASGFSTTIESALTANGATQAGIIVCSIMIGIALTAKLIGRYKSFLNASSAIDICASVLKLALIMVIAALMITPVSEAVQTGSSASGIVRSVTTTKTSFLFWLDNMPQSVEGFAFSSVTTNAIVATALSLLTVVLVLITACRYVSAITDKKGFLPLTLSLESILVIFGICYFVFSSGFASALPAIFGDTSAINVTVGGAVAILVLVLLNMFVSIAQFITSKALSSRSADSQASAL